MEDIFIRGLVLKSLVINCNGILLAFNENEFIKNLFTIKFYFYLVKNLFFIDRDELVQIIINSLYLRTHSILFINFSNAEPILKNLIDKLIQQNYLINNNNGLSFNCFDQSQLKSYLEQLFKFFSQFILNNWPEDLLKDIEIETNDNDVTVESITNFLNRVRKISKNDLVEFVKLDNQIVINWILQMDPDTPIKLEGEYIFINDDPTTNILIIKAINQLVELSDEYIS